MKRKKLNVKNIFLALVTLLLICFCIFMIYKILKPKDNVKEVVKEKKKETKKEQVGEKPTITLNGLTELEIVKNGIFDDLGASATDKEDGDLTSKVKVKDNVKYDTPGDYKITYSVTDKDGNTTSVDRKVTIFEVKEKDTDGISVLMYHYFYDDTAGETGENNNFMAKSLFEEQLNYLATNDYYIPTMKELSAYLDGKLDLPEKSVIITMDDGWDNNYTIAYPMAVKYKIPIVMFVVTSWTDVNLPLQKEMTYTGYVRFHSHTDNMHEGGCGEQHGARILCINHDEGVQDLKTSAEKIGNADALAYPCGDNNDHSLSIVTEAGYTLAFTTDYGKVTRGQNKLALPRVRMNDGISLQSFINSL